MSLAANPSTISFRSSQPTLPSTRLKHDADPNEEAATSDSSLSQYDRESIRGTPASSFSNPGTSPKIEPQAPTSPDTGAIEPTSAPSDGQIDDNSDDNSTLGFVPEKRNQYHNTPALLSGEQNGPSNAIKPLDGPGTHARSLRHSLGTAYRRVAEYKIPSNTIALVALFLSAYFGYETHRLSEKDTLQEPGHRKQVRGHLEIYTPSQLTSTLEDGPGFKHFHELALLIGSCYYHQTYGWRSS
jgi:hypothetical protein